MQKIEYFTNKIIHLKRYIQVIFQQDSHGGLQCLLVIDIDKNFDILDSLITQMRVKNHDKGMWIYNKPLYACHAREVESIKQMFQKYYYGKIVSIEVKY